MQNNKSIKNKFNFYSDFKMYFEMDKHFLKNLLSAYVVHKRK